MAHGDQTRAVRLGAEAVRAVEAYASKFGVGFRQAAEALVLTLPLVDAALPAIARKSPGKKKAVKP